MSSSNNLSHALSLRNRLADATEIVQDASESLERAKGGLESSTNLRNQIITLIRRGSEPEDIGLAGINLEQGLADTNDRIKRLRKDKWLARKYAIVWKTRAAVLKAKLAVVERLTLGGDAE